MSLNYKIYYWLIHSPYFTSTHITTTLNGHLSWIFNEIHSKIEYPVIVNHMLIIQYYNLLVFCTMSNTTVGTPWSSDFSMKLLSEWLESKHLDSLSSLETSCRNPNWLLLLRVNHSFYLHTHLSQISSLYYCWKKKM